MKNEYLLIDGYNIIHGWDNLREIAETDSLENARIKLLEEMSNYKGYNNNEIIVVFDAHKTKEPIRNIQKYNNISVVYTKEAETADNYIERVAHIISKDYNVKVATSDGLEQTIILGKGATRISARELQLEVEQFKTKINEKYLEKAKVNNNRLESHLDKDIIKWMEEMRRK